MSSMQSTTVFYNYIIPCDDGDDDSDDENGDDDNLDTLSLCIYYFSFSFFQQKKEDFFWEGKIFFVCAVQCVQRFVLLLSHVRRITFFYQKNMCTVLCACIYVAFFIHLRWLVRIKWDEKELCGRETFLGLFCVFFCYDFHKKRGRRCTYHFIKI